VTFPRPAFLFQNVLPLHQQRWVILRVWYFGPLEDNQWGGCRLDPKTIEARTFPADFCTRNFFGRGGVSRYVATPLTVALSPGHSDITRFRPCSPIATGNHLDRAEKIQNLLGWLAQLTFLIRVQAFRGQLRGELPHVQIFMNDDPTRSREMPSCSAIDLAEIRRFSKISSWVWSIISGVVVFLGRPGRGASQVEKSPRLNWSTQFFTVAYHGAYSPNISIRMASISFGVLPCRKKKLDDGSLLDVVEIARVAWHASFYPL